MTVTIDGAGRIVIPKAIREREGLVAGTELEVRAANGRIELEVACPPAKWERCNGMLVMVPPAGAPPITLEMINQLIEQDRNERGLIDEAELARLFPPAAEQAGASRHRRAPPGGAQKSGRRHQVQGARTRGLLSLYLYDTNCLVALAKTGQPHYAATSADLARRRAQGQGLVIAMHSVDETYSVLTRSPPPLRSQPSEAWRLVEDWATQAELVDLTPEERLQAIGGAAGAGVIGGQIHDYLIAACARKAEAKALVTWNLRHFARWGGADLDIVNPLGERA